jgi:hypothetical protein
VFKSGLLKGYGRKPCVNTFVQRLSAAGASKGIIYKRSGGFRGFVGLRLRKQDGHHVRVA